MEYPHIDSPFLREEIGREHPFIEGKWAHSYFEYLSMNEWVGYEKVDGMNMRIYLKEDRILYQGRTGNAQIPATLIDRLNEIFLPQEAKLREMFPPETCFYGEGYGGKIQKGGKYKPTSDFVLFDILINKLWVERENLEEIAKELNLDIVPVVAYGDLFSLFSLTRKGFLSAWSNGKNEFLAEGLVCHPRIPLQSRRGRRIMTKIKHSDFRKFINKENENAG